jgi:hypothetical protein
MLSYRRHGTSIADCRSGQHIGEHQKHVPAYMMHIAGSPSMQLLYMRQDTGKPFPKGLCHRVCCLTCQWVLVVTHTTLRMTAFPKCNATCCTSAHELQCSYSTRNEYQHHRQELLMSLLCTFS